MEKIEQVFGQAKKTIYLSGVAGDQQIRERIFVYNTVPKVLNIARAMLQRLDKGVAFVRDENGEYKQVGGTNTDNRRDIVDMIEKKYSSRKSFVPVSGGDSNIPAGFNGDGSYAGY